LKVPEAVAQVETVDDKENQKDDDGDADDAKDHQ
jgi:hypothetical protein